MTRPICSECKKRPCEISNKNKNGSNRYRSLCWKCRSLEDPNYKQHYVRYHAKLRMSVLQAYGQQCECCGEKEPLFLTIDHINGGGNVHRKIVGGGFPMYRWLKKQGFPKGYRVLCFNCNCGRQLNGGVCPHKH